MISVVDLLRALADMAIPEAEAGIVEIEHTNLIRTLRTFVMVELPSVIETLGDIQTAGAVSDSGSGLEPKGCQSTASGRTELRPQFLQQRVLHGVDRLTWAEHVERFRYTFVVLVCDCYFQGDVDMVLLGRTEQFHALRDGTEFKFCTSSVTKIQSLTKQFPEVVVVLRKDLDRMGNVNVGKHFLLPILGVACPRHIRIFQTLQKPWLGWFDGDLCFVLRCHDRFLL